MASQPQLSIGELAESSGVGRRAIRFYVQRGLLQPPAGLGRGRHYGQEHLERLQEIQKLQAAGHSLDAIKTIVHGETAPSAPKPTRYAARKARGVPVQLWTKIQLADGAELQLDTAKYDLDIDQLAAIQEAVASILPSRPSDRGDGSQDRKERK